MGRDNCLVYYGGGRIYKDSRMNRDSEFKEVIWKCKWEKDRILVWGRGNNDRVDNIFINIEIEEDYEWSVD